MRPISNPAASSFIIVYLFQYLSHQSPDNPIIMLKIVANPYIYFYIIESFRTLFLASLVLWSGRRAQTPEPRSAINVVNTLALALSLSTPQ